MVKKRSLINSKKKINKLKRDLMSKNNNSLLSSSYKRLKNIDIGKIFEKNILEVLKSEYGWKIPNIQKYFFYREIRHDGIKEFIILDKSRRLTIRNQTFLFTFSKDDNLSIIDQNLNLKINIPIKKNEHIEFPIKNERIHISPQKEEEIDGIFQNKRIDFSLFNKDGIITILNNVEIEKIDDFKYIIIEIKLSSNSVNDLISQLKKDKQIMKNIISEKILYIGFINDNKLKIDIEENIEELDFILFGLKNSTINERNMTYYIDWKTINEMKEIKKIQQIIIKELKSIKKYLKKKRNHSKK